ncbi:alanine-synthesizing transaminase [Flexibacter flexilis DSM 6793]|uniref:alanine transaminase n=1 Tax=Flexibacter flexilis DSM 6793 TaxID=927664 RepID=A0A1I1LAF4_9BACT|nr:alanine-synthesizing transaminase [Flexibacter flexilis DSM 6793]
MIFFEKSERLNNVHYEIRGPIAEKAAALEKLGHKIIKLNIGNPAPFGFDVPDEIIQDIILNLRQAQGYSDSKGLFAARKAVVHYAQTKHIPDVQVDDVYIGNGVSELILLCMQALLNEGDEVLIPAPDYPLWTAATTLSSGKAVHYLCDEASNWYPDLADLESKITSRTKALVIINPNNPTGTVYPKEIIEKMVATAEKHHLIIFSDEIYDKILYDGVAHHSPAAFTKQTLCVTMGGLSKNYRAAGFRAGWLILSGTKSRASSFIEGLTLLSSMRLCSNVIAQLGIQTALGGYQSIDDLVLPTGRLTRQRDICHKLLTSIDGVSCVKAQGAFYMFPKIDLERFDFNSDQEFVLDLLAEQHVFLVHGSGFNYPQNNHFRVVFLPTVEEINVAVGRIKTFLNAHRS